MAEPSVEAMRLGDAQSGQHQTIAYRRRMIFTEAEPLRRARMPRDGRWWAYETIRSGLTPTSQEVSSLQDAANASERRRFPDLVPVPDDTFHYSREVGDDPIGP
jgi:hypothetical protein